MRTSDSKVSCEHCKSYRELMCKNPNSPYGGKVRLPGMGCYAGTRR